MVKCPVCGKGFQKKPLLRSHINLVHGRKSQHVCSTCQKSFNGNGDLERHILTHSKDSELTPCFSCGKAYKMKEFMAFHHGIQAYMCPVCPKTCSDMNSIINQENIDNSKVGFKPIINDNISSDRCDKRIPSQRVLSGSVDASIAASNINEIDGLSSQVKSDKSQVVSKSSIASEIPRETISIASTEASLTAASNTAQLKSR